MYKLHHLETFKVTTSFSSGEYRSMMSEEKSTVGSAKVEEARKSMVMFVKAASLEKDCSFPLTWPLTGIKPPAKKDIPSTRSRFESTLPSSVPLTTSNSPALNVCTVKIISTALPKVAFRRPPMTSLLRPAANSSVASPRSLAKGIIATKLKANVAPSPQLLRYAKNPTGQKTSNTQIGSNSRFLRPVQFPSKAVCTSPSFVATLMRSLSPPPKLTALRCFSLKSSFFCCTSNNFCIVWY
mmetsp:Transcript_17153/g.36850  ORF Transcript_17153/g.36850 Transcript_17153/m.36850 type:complete len:240 (-) Transcript_17153:314-1033(-)